MKTTRITDAVDVCFQGRRGGFALDVAFAFPGRGVTALFGPSGCGKTSVLRLIAGLDRMDGGRLSVNGAVWQSENKCLPVHRRPVGYVFQEASLFPHLSVRANLVYGRKRTGATTGPGVDEVAHLLGFQHLLERAPAHLSGGERQRVAIGRALLSSPQILLMDEPLAGLDHVAKSEILPYLEQLHAELDIPVLYVSHDLTEVERLADRVVLMEAGQVRASGPTAALLTHPALPFAHLPDAATVLSGKVHAYDADYGLTTMLVGDTPFVVPERIGEIGSRHRFRIAASDVAICRAPTPESLSFLNTPLARITDLQPAGDHQVTLFLSLGPSGAGAVLLARITRRASERLGLQPGDTVHALIKGVALLAEA